MYGMDVMNASTLFMCNSFIASFPLISAASGQNERLWQKVFIPFVYCSEFPDSMKKQPGTGLLWLCLFCIRESTIDADDFTVDVLRFGRQQEGH